MQRNFYPPTFQANYTVTITDAQPPGTLVVQVVAADNDIIRPYNSLTYNLVTGGEVAETFYVDSSDGRIVLRKKVTAGQTFNFQIDAKDGGNPPLTGTVFVRVNVVASVGNLTLGELRSPAF